MPASPHRVNRPRRPTTWSGFRDFSRVSGNRYLQYGICSSSERWNHLQREPPGQHAAAMGEFDQVADAASTSSPRGRFRRRHRSGSLRAGCCSTTAWSVSLQLLHLHRQRERVTAQALAACATAGGCYVEKDTGSVEGVINSIRKPDRERKANRLDLTLGSFDAPFQRDDDKDRTVPGSHNPVPVNCANGILLP